MIIINYKYFNKANKGTQMTNLEVFQYVQRESTVVK